MYKQISHTEAEQLMNDQELVIADVRDLASYQAGHISNAIHLSLDCLKEYSQESDKHKSVLLYCYHGLSSQSVAQYLVEQGFKKVYSLIGGLETWKVHHPTSDANS